MTKSRLRFLRWFGPSCSPSCWSQRWPYSRLSLVASGDHECTTGRAKHQLQTTSWLDCPLACKLPVVNAIGQPISCQSDLEAAKRSRERMKKLSIGDVTIISIIERDGPWRTPQEMFPAYDPINGKRHLAELDPEVFDPASGKMVITYQTYIVRTPRHTVLIDTCTGEDKGYPPPMDFPKQPWLDGFAAAGLRFQDIDYVFCTHLHIDHCGWNTVLRDGRWVPTFPKAKYIFHKGEYAAWEESTKRGETRAGGGGNVFRYNCQPIVEAGQALLVDDGYQLDDTFWLVPTPGHSPHHCCVNIRSRGQHAVVTRPFAPPLLRQYPLARTARGRD